MRSLSDLEGAAPALAEMTSPCRLCPHACGADRAHGGQGRCRLGAEILVASAGPHYGEEQPLVGTGGSGTIFFSSCNLACCFCQNYEISQAGAGEEVTVPQLADMMLQLQARGCHNVNLVTPTHVIPGIVAALAIARGDGLRIPVVYNCGGYESVETLRLLEGIVDIYMPDIKYSDDDEALRYSGAPGYWTRAREAVLEMHRQVGDLLLDSRGIAVRGLLIRHLVLPGGLAGTDRVMDFIANRVSRNTWVNVMSQYRPCYRAHRVPELSRPLARSEYRAAVVSAQRAGLSRGLPGGA